MLKMRFPFIYASTNLDTKHYKLPQIINWKLSIHCLAPQHILQFFHFCYTYCLCLCLWQLCSLLWGPPQCSTEQSRYWKKKSFCNGWLFLGNLDPLSLTPGGPTVPLVCGFRRQDNLLAYHELFANLYELKSGIWFWEEYNHFEQICRVYRFDQFSTNFTWNNDKRNCVGKFW